MYGKTDIYAVISKELIAEWSIDPRVKQQSGEVGGFFDSLENTAVDDCLHRLVEKNELNA